MQSLGPNYWLENINLKVEQNNLCPTFCYNLRMICGLGTMLYLLAVIVTCNFCPQPTLLVLIECWTRSWFSTFRCQSHSLCFVCPPPSPRFREHWPRNPPLSSSQVWAISGYCDAAHGLMLYNLEAGAKSVYHVKHFIVCSQKGAIASLAQQNPRFYPAQASLISRNECCGWSRDY